MLDSMPELRECHDCGLFHRIGPIRPGSVARCRRCNAVLWRARHDPFDKPLALALSALALFAVAIFMPFMSLNMGGQQVAASLFTGPEQLERQGLWQLALLVAVTTLVAPMMKLCATIYVLVGARLRRPPSHLRTVFRWIEHLTPWSMIEVYLLGVFVAYTKLIDMAQVHVGIALFAFGGVMLAMTAADSALDPEAIWRRLDRLGLHSAQGIGATGTPMPDAVGCHCCGLVSRMIGHAPARCPRCGGKLHARKPNSIARTWALLLAAAILYVPANLYPVMTVISLGNGTPDTILSGVEELAHAGMWPLALLVFFASITVPMLKLIGLIVMLVATRMRSRRRLRDRTVLYRIVEFVGRWSMIDVFMLSILVGLVQLGNIATIEPGVGAVSFASVVILTMLAAESFDPRLMWDAAETGGEGADHERHAG
jgi:paraquat-inducible protein A